MVCLLFSCDAPVNFEGGNPDRKAKMAMLPRLENSAEKQEISTERKLIKTGFLEMAVQDVIQTKSEIEEICEAHNAYISSETQTNYGERLEFEQEVRIPAAHFDEVIKMIEELGHETKNKNIRTSDVTEEFIDKEARVKTKKELENRYREILKQAREVSDILSIEAQLNHVRADIESMEGRLNYIRNQVAFSTLALSFHEPIGPEFGYGSKTVAALSNGWDNLLFFIIGMLNFWPFLLIGGVSVYFVVRRRRLHQE